MSAVSLSDMIIQAKNEQHEAKHINDILKHMLGPSQVEAVLKLIGNRCRSENKQKLRRRLELPLALLKNHGIYSRLLIDGDKVEYTCGQSWDDEMRTIRQCLLDN